MKTFLNSLIRIGLLEKILRVVSLGKKFEVQISAVLERIDTVSPNINNPGKVKHLFGDQ